MCRNSIIHTNDNILFKMKGLVFLYHLIDVSRHVYLNTMETLQRAEQQDVTNKSGNEANNKLRRKSLKNRSFVRILPNTKHKH